ncbi:hypothetical protein RhiirA4_516540 [Rhizophagus irregularis]|uniref:Uncharacterized protein n=1 Tax=Rhizophagus irregularis TaxID=588596 RepID=A0A2I1FWF6_9GLOM|nr:hypothetical protein RhiirA4_516540 [Rhizophagus irregularis]
MFVNEEEKNKPNLQDLQNNNYINQRYGISSSPTSAEPHSFLSENKKEFHTKNSEQVNQNISHDTQNKIKRPPIKAKTISFPIKGEKAKFNFESPELTHRLRAVNTSDKEKSDEKHESKEKVNEKMDFYTKKIHWTWILLALIVCAVLIYMKFRLKEIYVDDKKFVVKFQPFEDFASSTTKLVEDIVQVDLPSSGSVMDGTVSCRRFANIVEDSPAFKETGSSIAKLLRAFSAKIMDAGVALEDMYRNGNMLFWILNSEISEMMSKFNSYNRWFGNEDETFFRSRVHRLVKSIEEFSVKVTHARKAIVDAESYRGPAERKVRQGIAEATKFIHHDPDRAQEYILKFRGEGYILEKIGSKANDVLNVMDELKHAENKLNILEKSHEALDLINKILSVYKNKLFYFESQLGKIKKSKVTKKDLDKLEKLVNILKSSQQKFIDKETLEDKEKARIYV